MGTFQSAVAGMKRKPFALSEGIKKSLSKKFGREGRDGIDLKQDGELPRTSGDHHLAQIGNKREKGWLQSFGTVALSIPGWPPLSQAFDLYR